MSKQYKLVKRWRLDEVGIYDLGVRAGIYVHRDSGRFYARVPEQADGELYTGRDKAVLMEEVEAALRAYYTLEWKPTILVAYPNPMQYTGSPKGSWTGRGCRWVPNDFSSASDVVGPLRLYRVHRAEGPGRRILYETWDHQQNWSIDSGGESDIVLPYDEATWEALHDFQERIRELDHQIRGLFARDDFTQLVLAVSRAPLLLVDTDDG